MGLTRFERTHEQCATISAIARGNVQASDVGSHIDRLSVPLENRRLARTVSNPYKYRWFERTPQHFVGTIAIGMTHCQTARIE